MKTDFEGRKSVAESVINVNRTNDSSLNERPMPEYENGTLIVTEDGIFVHASVNNVHVKFTVDSGSKPTILNRKLFEQLHDKPSLVSDFTLSVADGSPLQNIGRGDFSLDIGPMTIEHKIAIADIKEEGLLGYDFLHKYKCELNLQTNKLIVNNPDPDMTQMPIPETLEDDLPSLKCHRVAVTETTVIPPNSEQLVSGKLMTKPENEEMGVLEPREIFTRKHPVMVASTLVNPSNEIIPIRVINPTQNPVKIHKHTIAAMYHGVSEVVDPQSDENNTCCRHVNSTDASVDINPAPEKMAGKICVPDHLVELWRRSCVDLEETQAIEVARLLSQYADVFAKSPDDLGLTTLVEHQIKLDDATPIKQRARRKPMLMREEERRHVEDLLQRGLIEPSDSPWASPTVLVKKKNGSTRFCVDYRKVNERTIKDSYPLPLIGDALDCLEGAKWFSTLDLASGYWQVPISETSKPITAFVTEAGHWQWRVLPFGLSNAPACFERLMDKTLAGLQWKTCLLYLDDVISHAKTFDQAIERLEEIFMRLRDANLKLGPTKCQLFQKSVTYLGHVVSETGISTDPQKIEAVKSWPTPENLTEARSFLGFSSYYRRFIKGYADIAKPLYTLTEKNTPFLWTEKCEDSFNQLKKALISAPVLAYPSRDGQYVLDCDASNIGVGGILSVTNEDSTGERPVAYFSRTLTKSERRYCVTRRELLAIIASIKEFHHYLYGKKFLIRTDHGALRWLTNFKNPQAQTARWIEILGTYDYEIRHRPGRYHQNADGLSRKPCAACKQCERIEHQNDDQPIHIRRAGKLCPEHEQCHDLDYDLSLGEKTLPPIHMAAKSFQVAAISEDHNDATPDGHGGEDDQDNPTWMSQWEPSRLRQAQKEDRELNIVISWKETHDKRPEWQVLSNDNPKLKTYWSHWDQLYLINGVLYKRWISEWGDIVKYKLVVPDSLRSMVFDSLHKHRTAGHVGERKTIERVGERYWWTNWREFVRISCKKCDSCASKKPPNKTPRAPMKTFNVGAPMERIALDVMGPLPLSDRGNKYILVIGDHFTKWIEAFSMPNQEASTVADILAEEFICRYGVPRIIHSDQGRNFESNLFSELCKIFDVDKQRSSALHAQTNGMIERQNKVIQNMLSMFVASNQKDWDIHLPYMMMAYRSAIHESLKCSPNEMVLGRNVEVPIDIILGQPPVQNQTDIRPTDYVTDLQERLDLVHKYARTNLNIASQKQKRYYDHRCDKRPLFQRGDPVWLHNPQRKKGICPKLSCQWEGPFLVIDKLCDVVFKIQRSVRTKPKVVHANRLKKYLGDNPPVSWLVPHNSTSESATDIAESSNDTVLSEPDIPHDLPDEDIVPASLEADGPEPDESNDLTDTGEKPEVVVPASPEPETLRRSNRCRKPPKRYEDYELDIESLP